MSKYLVMTNQMSCTNIIYRYLWGDQFLNCPALWLTVYRINMQYDHITIICLIVSRLLHPKGSMISKVQAGISMAI